MATVSMRRATANDVPFLRRKQWEAVLASPRLVAAMGLDELRQIEERVWATWPGPDEAALVAEAARGLPLGALILRVHERAAGRVVGYRQALAVEGEARRRGIGRRLLEQAQRVGRDAGADYLLLQVDPSNEPAVRASRATGFELGDAHGVVPTIVRFGERAED